jgi:FkbM family methyltransferase
MSYSQNSEESVILDFYKDKPNGKFIDIGAYHITRFSNVRALYEKGWGGVLVEPQPENFNAINEHYLQEPRIAVLNFAVGSPEGEVTFYESNGDAVGSTSREHMEKWKAGGVKYSEIKVQQVTPSDFFNEFGHNTDFLSIDTEATNISVFGAVPIWVWEQISMLCIEHDGEHQMIEDALSAFGFTALYLNAENIILAKQ